jgi:hypothetical protein
LPIPDHIGTALTDNRFILDELSYDSHILATSMKNDIPKLNTCQNQAFEVICSSVLNNPGQTFFVYDYGGTGKTFLWTILLNFIRSQGKLHWLLLHQALQHFYYLEVEPHIHVSRYHLR